MTVVIEGGRGNSKSVGKRDIAKIGGEGHWVAGRDEARELWGCEQAIRVEEEVQV